MFARFFSSFKQPSRKLRRSQTRRHRLGTLSVGRLGHEDLEPRIVLAASTLPAGFQETLVVGGLYEPTSQAFAPDGRIFVSEKPYGVRVVKDGVLLSTRFLTLPVERSGERGVQSVLLDPNFSTNGFIYVYYTHSDPTTPYDRLSRFTAMPGNPDVGNPASEVVLIDRIATMQPGYHNGGLMRFGADGMLYVGIGDTNVPNSAGSY